MANSETRLKNGSANGSLWEMTRHAQVVTFIGAGGKTTCLRSMTQELESAGQQVIATTTTKVYPQEYMNVWKSTDPPDEQDGACFWYVNGMDASGKWIGPPVQVVDAAIVADRLSLKLDANTLHASSRTVPDLHARYWVIEGDGARGLRLKCWESHEPQIPLGSNCAVLVLDRDLWGNVLEPNYVHRPQRCSDLLGRVWNAESAWRYFLESPVFDPRYGNLSWVVFLNSPRGVGETSNQMLNGKSVAVESDPLKEISEKWLEIQAQGDKLKHRPIHLRLAVGDAKEGTIEWCDLW